MKKVSIVLPVYNGEYSIDSAIASIVNQTYRNIELIIVNDCSTDSTKKIIEDWACKDDRIMIVNNGTNQKLPRSLNIGFAIATGDYLTWTSDDNMYHIDAIETMVKYLDDNTQVDFVYTDFSIVNMDGSFREELTKPEPNKIAYYNPVGACFLYKKELARKIGVYDPDMFLAEDYEYWIRAYLNGRMVHLNKNLYDYGWNDKSLTATRENEIRQQTFLAKERHFDDLYMLCKTREEQVEFLAKMLSMLADPNERRRKKKEYYKLNKAFAIQDFKRSSKKFVRHVMSFGKKVIKSVNAENR